jgi:hypothetical protein
MTKPKNKIKLKIAQIIMCLAREQQCNITIGDEARRSIQFLNLTQDSTHIRASKACTLHRSLSARGHTTNARNSS